MLRPLKIRFDLWDAGIALACLIFALNKIPYLSLPYFWDEAWVYAPAVFDMLEHGPSLSPNSIDPELSRGHPILFHFLAACWLTLFGGSTISAHSFALTVSLLLIVAVYRLGIALVNKTVGFWAAVLFAMQPIFIQQSGLLLPEVMLSLFVTLTLLFYLKRNALLYIIAATAMLLTKETGLLVIGMVGLMELYEYLRERNFSFKRTCELISVGIPVALAFLYFLIQYQQFGWFMFPEHVHMFDTDPNIWGRKLDLVFRSLFMEQQRPILIITTLAAATFGWQRAPQLLRLLMLLILLTFLTLKGILSWLPPWYYRYAFPLVLTTAIFWTGTFLKKEGTRNHLYLPLAAFIIYAMLKFTSAHFVIGRYLLYLIPLLLLALVSMNHISLRRNPFLFNALMVCLGLMFYHYANKADRRMNRHDNMHYVSQIAVLQDGIAFLRDSVGFDNGCFAGSFLVQQALAHPIQGYVDDHDRPGCVLGTVDSTVNHVMMISYETDPGLEQVRSDSSFVCVFVESLKEQTVWVYARKNIIAKRSSDPGKPF